jgi:thymidylate kinase
MLCPIGPPDMQRDRMSGSTTLPVSPAGSRTHGVFLRLLQAAQDNPRLMLVPIRHRADDLETALDGGDYDFLLPSGSRDDFLRLLMNVAASADASFTLDQTNPDKLRVLLHAPDAHRNITLELWAHLSVRDPARCSARRIAWSAIEPVLVRTAGGWRLPPSIEALYYLSHLATLRKDLRHPEVQRRLGRYRLVDGDAGSLIDRLRAEQNIEAIAAEANRLLVAEKLLEPLSGPAARLRSILDAVIKRRIRQRRRAITHGRIFAVTGPDGVGKTTVITALCADLAAKARAFRFKSLFRHNPFYTVLYALRFKSAAAAQGGELAKNLFDEMQAPALFRIARFLHPLLLLRTRFGAYRCCDRYFHDLLFTDLRRHGAVPRLRDGWERLVPTMPLPAWHLHLDAPDAIILGRKRELSPAALDCYRKGLFAIHLAAATPYFTYLNTGRSLEEVRAVLRLAGAPLGLRFKSWVDLSTAQLLGEGNERSCFAHPTDPGLVIKVKRHGRPSRGQNRIDRLYSDALAGRGVPFDHIPRCHGAVATSLGEGLVCERIRDADDGSSLPLAEAVRRCVLAREHADRLLDGLFAYLRRHWIVFADVGDSNLLCQRLANGDVRLVIIDGLGARHPGLKLRLHSQIPVMARVKLRKQWPLLLANLWRDQRDQPGLDSPHSRP